MWFAFSRLGHVKKLRCFNKSQKSYNPLTSAQIPTVSATSKGDIHSSTIADPKTKTAIYFRYL